MVCRANKGAIDMAREAISEEDYKKVVFEEGGSLVINLAETEEAKFELLPRGVFPGEIDEFSFGLSENSNAPMFTCVVALTHPDHDGTKVRTYFSFSKKALPFTKRGLKQLAPDIDWESPFNPEEIERSGTMLNRKVDVYITHEKDDQSGEKRHRVQRLVPQKEGGGAATNGTGAGGAKGGKFF
jgi:hypothetical protein